MTGKKQRDVPAKRDHEDLALDAQAVKDLEPKTPGDIRGGRSSSGGSKAGSIAGSDVT